MCKSLQRSIISSFSSSPLSGLSVVMPPAPLAMNYALFHSIYLFITVSFKIKMNLKLALASTSLVSQQTWESAEVARQEGSLSKMDFVAALFQTLQVIE